jgi:hypothetical protein
MTEAAQGATVPVPPGGVRYERSDANVRSVVLFGVSLAGIVLVVIALLWWMFFDLKERQDRARRSRFPLSEELQGETVGERVREVPEPRLEAFDLGSPDHTVGRLRPGAAGKEARDEEAVLREGGDGRIPIGEAMRLLIREEAAKGQGDSARQLRGIPRTDGESSSGRLLPEERR